MQIYANEITQVAIKRDFYYAFAETRYPGVPDLNLIGINHEPFLVGDIKVQPIQVMHHKMPVLGFRMGDFTYITDANRIESDQQQKIKGSEIMVLNALRKQDHLSHFTLEQALLLIEQLQIPTGYLTHISHQLGKHAEVEAELPPQIHLAYDGLVLELS